MKSSKVSIGVIFPSRGLSFSETCEELLLALGGYDYEIYFSHGKALPDCFNEPLERALKANHTHIWIVEDDMVLPWYILTKMLDEKKPVVACDYPVTRTGVGSVQYDRSGKALFSGTGCLLIGTPFVSKFKQPVFRTDIRWDIHATREGVELKKRYDTGETYGMHDVTFGLECYRMGEPICIMPEIIGQRKLVEMGKTGTNQGQHTIEIWDKVVKQPDFINLLHESQESPLVAIKLKDGIITNVSPETATRLEKDSKGKRIKAQDVEFSE